MVDFTDGTFAIGSSITLSMGMIKKSTRGVEFRSLNF